MKILVTIARTPEQLVAAAKMIEGISIQRPLVVTVEEEKTDRSTAQNRLYWAWIHDASVTKTNEHAGNTKDWWHNFFKEHSLLNIYIRDDVAGTAETMAALYDVKVNCGVDTFNNMKKFVVENISTTDANVKQFAEYLQDVERFCNSVGIKLRTDQHIYAKAMGRS